MARRSLYVAVILLLATSCSKTVERIEIVPVRPDGDVPGSARASTYEATLRLVLDGLERELALPRVDVSLVLFPNRRTFEQGLLQIGYTPALARSASSFNAIGGARAVLMNAASTDGLTRASRIRLIAHEVVHTLQYRLSGGARGASEQWLREGFAEWVACRVTARAGLGSFDFIARRTHRPVGGRRPRPSARPVREACDLSAVGRRAAALPGATVRAGVHRRGIARGDAWRAGCGAVL